MRNRKKKNRVLILLIVILTITIGFALLSTTLFINGTAIIKSNTWNIHWDSDSIHETSGSVVATTPAAVTDADEKNIGFAVELELPGDYYEFTADAINEGSIDGLIEDVEVVFYMADGTTPYDGTTPERTLPTEITYSLTHADGTPVDENEVITHSGGTIGYKFKVGYDSRATTLPSEPVIVKPVIEITPVQHREESKYICKRATTLHTETCVNDHTDFTYGCTYDGYVEGNKGTTITYGSLGTNGQLTAGDAFDCDVNGDGTFDAATERFYYLSGIDGDDNSDYAVLAYYSNVKNGVADNSRSYEGSDYNYRTRYHEPASSRAEMYENFDGPSNLLKDLPTTSNWKNVKFVNHVRDIKDDQDTVRYQGFDYAGKAARLISIKEVSKACKGTNVVSVYDMQDYNAVSSCNYLFENTVYQKSWIGNTWLESITTGRDIWGTGDIFAWEIESSRMIGNGDRIDCDYGVRPAIEVLKTDIEY